MRPSKKLRQGNTIYIAQLYWDADSKFYYSTVNACFIDYIKTINGTPYARYTSYEDCIPGLPLLQGYMPRNLKENSLVHLSKIFYTKNRALKHIQHAAMLSNHEFQKEWSFYK